MFIFGWGRQTIKQIGAVFKNLCSHCHNEEYWILTRITTWFTLFFIPVIPYSIKYFLSCPICKYGLTLNDKQIGELKPIAEANQLLVNGQITQDEFRIRMNQINNLSPKEVEGKIIEPDRPKILNDGNKELTYCSECGNQLTREIKYCGNCGSATN